MFWLWGKMHLYLLNTKKHSASLNDMKEKDVFMPQGFASLNVRLVLKTPSTFRSLTVACVLAQGFTPWGSIMSWGTGEDMQQIVSFFPDDQQLHREVFFSTILSPCNFPRPIKIMMKRSAIQLQWTSVFFQ